MNKFNIPASELKEMRNTLINFMCQRIKQQELKVKEIQIDRDFIDDLFGAGNTVVSNIYARVKKLNHDFKIINNPDFKNTNILVRVIYHGNFEDFLKPYKHIEKFNQGWF